MYQNSNDASEIPEIDAKDYLINYNLKFANADKVMFRDEVTTQLLSVLIGKTKPNALLIGSAGVGKTKIVENLARMMVNFDPAIPAMLQCFTIYEFPLSSIVSGSCFVGQLEEKLNSIIEFAEDPSNHAILFIDEIHMLCSDNQSYSKMAEILKPALARGKMRVIGATTLQESQNLIGNPAFNRRFSHIIVDELSCEQTVEILKNMKSSFIDHYGTRVKLEDNVFERTVLLANQFHFAGNHRPDTAITLLDRTIAEAFISCKSRTKPIIISEEHLRSTAVSLATGNSHKADIDYTKLREHLHEVKGQDNIIDELIEHLEYYDTPIFPKVKPLTLLFTGSSGVGKTEIAKILAREITGTTPITLNMTEYHSHSSINRIIGSPAGYAGYDSKAELPFDILESNPYQVILLDEFEKCNKAVQRLFMSAFDEGFIKTSMGKTIDFSKSIIIATTNASHEAYVNRIGFQTESATKSIDSEVQELSKWFDTELLNRFHAILSFNELSKSTYRAILSSIYEQEMLRITSENPNIKLEGSIPDSDLEDIVKNTYIPAFGARPAMRAVHKYIKTQVIRQ